MWTLLPLLAESRALPAVLAQQLGLRSPPPLSAVLQHLHLVRGQGWLGCLLLVFLHAFSLSAPFTFVYTCHALLLRALL